MDAIVTVQIMDGSKLKNTLTASIVVPQQVVEWSNSSCILASEWICRAVVDKLKKGDVNVTKNVKRKK